MLFDGTENAEILRGSAEDDTFIGRGGNDTFYGSGGIDTIILSGGVKDYIITPAKVTVSPPTSSGYGFDVSSNFITDKNGIEGTDTFSEIEVIKFDDATLGWNGHGWAEVPSASNSDDVLMGSHYSDLLYGFDGNDNIFGGSNDDGLSGGNGNDTLTGGNGNDVLFDYHGDDLLIGGNGSDGLGGFFGNNTLMGGNGDDTLYAYGGYAPFLGETGDGIHNLLFGEAGNDRLIVDSGDSTLDGGIGQDTLSASGRGDHIMTGGKGADIFIFYTIRQTNVTITDFSKNDTIDLWGSIQNYAQVVPLLGTDQQGNATISFESGGMITLLGVKPNELTARDFEFHLYD